MLLNKPTWMLSMLRVRLLLVLRLHLKRRRLLRRLRLVMVLLLHKRLRPGLLRVKRHRTMRLRGVVFLRGLTVRLLLVLVSLRMTGQLLSRPLPVCLLLRRLLLQLKLKRRLLLRRITLLPKVVLKLLCRRLLRLLASMRLPLEY
jgi:hypothetical protein